jgi:hypothetical protein
MQANGELPGVDNVAASYYVAVIWFTDPTPELG